MFKQVDVSTYSAGTIGLEVRRAHAARTTGKFLVDCPDNLKLRLLKSSLSAVANTGNGVFKWGGEIECVAIRR